MAKKIDPNMQALLTGAIRALGLEGGYVHEDLMRSCSISPRVMAGRWSFFKRLVEEELTPIGDRLDVISGKKNRKMLVSTSGRFVAYKKKGPKAKELATRGGNYLDPNSSADAIKFISHGGFYKTTEAAYFADCVTKAMREAFLKSKDNQLMGHAYARDRLLQASLERQVPLVGRKKVAGLIEQRINPSAPPASPPPTPRLPTP